MRRNKFFLMVVATLAATLGVSIAGANGQAVQRGHDTVRSAQVAGLPRAVPLPPGVVVGTGHGPGRWSVLEVVRGSAPVAQRSAVAFYVHRGFHRDSAYGVHGRGYRIMMIAANRDHSAARSNLTVVVNRQP